MQSLIQIAAAVPATAPAIVIAVRCHYCSRHRLPSEIIPIGTGGAKMCHVCHERHTKALQMIDGRLPFACQECGSTPEQLTHDSPDGNASLWMYPKDGIYELLCRKCSDAYEKRRLDLFGDTAYGYHKKLKGAK